MQECCQYVKRIHLSLEAESSLSLSQCNLSKSITKPRFRARQVHSRRILSLVPDTTLVQVQDQLTPGGLYDVHYDNGDNELFIPGL